MNYPHTSEMPPLPNAVSSSRLPYPIGSNQSVNMSMPMPSRPTQLETQAGFVPSGYVSQSSYTLNPNQLPYPTQPTALTPYPRTEQQVSYGGNFMPPYQTTCLSSTMTYPSNPNQPGNLSKLPSAYPIQAISSSAPPMLPYATQSVPQYGVQFDPNFPHNNMGHFQQTSLPGSAYPNSMGSNFIHRIQGNPTVFPFQAFNPANDAQALRKAMKGFGTDENTLINIICKRSNEQRQVILSTYKTLLGRDLIKDICCETSGNFEAVLVALLTPIHDFYARELYEAMCGAGTDEDVLIEVFCSISNLQIHAIKQSYGRIYGKNLESELKSETSFNFKHLLVSLCNASRDESGIVDPNATARDARELLDAGVRRIGTDESKFNMILGQRSFDHIRLVAQQYQQIAGHSLEKAIKKEFSGDIENGLLAILKYSMNKSDYFAELLHKSMVGLGTNDRQLIRLLVTRSEIDLNDIKATFQQKYGKSLRSWIDKDTTGHYKHALCALIGE